MIFLRFSEYSEPREGNPTLGGGWGAMASGGGLLVLGSAIVLAVLPRRHMMAGGSSLVPSHELDQVDKLIDDSDSRHHSTARCTQPTRIDWMDMEGASNPSRQNGRGARDDSFDIDGLD